MKLIVSKDQDHHFYVYRLDSENKVTEIVFPSFSDHDLMTPQSRPLLPGFLPFEIQIQVLRQLFKQQVLAYNFDEALQVAFINKTMLNMICRVVYGVAYTTPQMIHRLCRSFYLLATLHDEYVTCPNLCGSARVGIKLIRMGSLAESRTLNPWNFCSEVELVPLETVTGVIPISGRAHGDTAWFFGSERNGIIDAESVKTPVFVLILQDYTGSLIPSDRNMANNQSFKAFARFMKAIYGQHSAVFVMARPRGQMRNPFINISDYLIPL